MGAVGGVMRVGPALVIEMVYQSSEAREGFVSARFASVGADASFYGQHVFAQRFRLRVFADQIPGVSARWQGKCLQWIWTFIGAQVEQKENAQSRASTHSSGVNRSSHKALNYVSYSGAAIQRICLLQIETHFETQTH